MDSTCSGKTLKQTTIVVEIGYVYRVQAVGARPASDAATANNKHGVMRRNPAYAETRTVVHYCDSKRRNERAGINDRLHTYIYLCRESLDDI